MAAHGGRVEALARSTGARPADVARALGWPKTANALRQEWFDAFEDGLGKLGGGR
jgi:hypothetical protein